VQPEHIHLSVLQHFQLSELGIKRRNIEIQCDDVLLDLSEQTVRSYHKTLMKS
jgi:hypothetical protein